MNLLQILLPPAGLRARGLRGLKRAIEEAGASLSNKERTEVFFFFFLPSGADSDMQPVTLW
jgi:hypothetical protein